MKRQLEQPTPEEYRLRAWRDWQWDQVKLLFLVAWPSLCESLGQTAGDLARPTMALALDLRFRFDVGILCIGNARRGRRAADRPWREREPESLHRRFSFIDGYDALLNQLSRWHADHAPCGIRVECAFSMMDIRPVKTHAELAACLERLRNHPCVPCLRYRVT